MKILITGGAGFIGSTLVPELLHRYGPTEPGSRITVLDSFLYGNHTSLATCCESKNFEIVHGDARDLRVVEPLARSHDVIIPLAALVGAPLCERLPDEAREVNCRAISLLCELLSPSQLVLFPNTNSGYGIAEDAPCDETSPLLPISVYGRTKCEAERIVMERENSVAFRLATVFGASPRMRTDLLVQDFVQRACCSLPLVLYQPNARRNFVHIRDVARAFLWALAEPKMRGQVFNCGDTRANMTKLQLCEAVNRHVPSFAWTIGEGSDPDKRDYVVINDKLERTGWRPGYTLDDGIVELIKAFTMVGDRKLGNA